MQQNFQSQKAGEFFLVRDWEPYKALYIYVLTYWFKPIIFVEVPGWAYNKSNISTKSVCKHNLIIYGYLKFTFKKAGTIKKIKKKNFFWNRNYFLWKFKISSSQIFRINEQWMFRALGNQRVFATGGISVEWHKAQTR